MKLSECKMGVVVKSTSFASDTRIGMIVGITQNSSEEAIPLVQWQDGSTRSIHQSNLKLYEE